MRKILTLILDYFVILILGTIIGLFIYSQYFNSISLVAGKHVPFTRDIFLYGIFQSLPVVFLLIPFAMLLYKIRHQSAPKASFITYCALCATTWFFLYPLSLTLQNKVYESLKPIDELVTAQPLSGKYFRNANGSIFYFVKDADSETANVFELINPENPEKYAEEKSIDVSAESDFSKYSTPFHDSLSQESMQDIPYLVIQTFYSIKMQAVNAWKNGYIAWLCFCSIGFALSSIYASLKFSAWKMVNAFIDLAFTSIVIWFNAFYFTSNFNGLRNFLHSLFYDSGHLNVFTSRNIEFPLMLINCLIGLILTACGIVLAVLRNQEKD